MAKKRANGEGNIRKRTDGTQGVGQVVDPHFEPYCFQHFCNKKHRKPKFSVLFEPLAGFEPPTSSLPMESATGDCPAVICAGYTTPYTKMRRARPRERTMTRRRN